MSAVVCVDRALVALKGNASHDSQLHQSLGLLEHNIDVAVFEVQVPCAGAVDRYLLGLPLLVRAFTSNTQMES